MLKLGQRFNFEHSALSFSRFANWHIRVSIDKCVVYNVSFEYEEYCTISDCAVLDIVFVVDESGSICDDDPSFDRAGKICDNWRAVRRFIREVVLSLPVSESDVHIGLLTFRDNVEIDWQLDT